MREFTSLCKETLADMDTPVSAYLKLCRGRPDSFLLESVETKEFTGRYSIVAFDPLFGLEVSAGSGRAWDPQGEACFASGELFTKIREMLGRFRVDALPEVPSVGSLMGFVGYDAVRYIESLPGRSDSSLPVARLVFPSRFVVFDHMRRNRILIAIDRDQAACRAKMRAMHEELSKPLHWSTSGSGCHVQAPPRDRYCTGVQAAKEYIASGHIFQVVLSDSFGGETDVSPFEVYRRLRVMSPSPYMFFLDMGAYQLLGASPETLVKVRDGAVTIMPIAGTRGRSNDPGRDKELEADLLASDKEGAEHLMLVDRARNDASRVSRYGTVRVEPFRSVQRYSHVMHLVSQVRGTLADGADVVDAFTAGFPAGTVSGAPKVRAMQIIDELEADCRGPYAGAVGYFGPNGAMDTCIAIRTMLFQGNQFTVRVGAGIVADSIPELEYQEIENKAAQSIAALRAAAEGTS